MPVLAHARGPSRSNHKAKDAGQKAGSAHHLAKSWKINKLRMVVPTRRGSSSRIVLERRRRRREGQVVERLVRLEACSQTSSASFGHMKALEPARITARVEGTARSSAVWHGSVLGMAVQVHVFNNSACVFGVCVCVAQDAQACGCTRQACGY